MDCQTGDIYHLTPEEMKEKETELKRKLFQLHAKDAEMLMKQNTAFRKKWVKHQPCPCGSGKKTFKCCAHKYY